jgi:alpha-beta hydrolase superfamily lysophospholipase
MMPAAKESWSAFAFALAERGISSLAIDFRGHGASDGGPDGYKSFTPEEHQAKRLDVEAGLAWLRAKAALPIAVAGASIGANLALRAIAEHDDVASCVALSPGLDYRGVRTDDVIGRLRPGQRVLIVDSVEDALSKEGVDALEAGSAGRADFFRMRGLGHGTRMLERDQDLFRKVVEWMSV